MRWKTSRALLHQGNTVETSVEEDKEEDEEEDEEKDEEEDEEEENGEGGEEEETVLVLELDAITTRAGREA